MLSAPKWSDGEISVASEDGEEACPRDQFLININGIINYAWRNGIKH